jgi:4-amino-4-deoxy-L-arabinose transferase-like glycosyltransferase
VRRATRAGLPFAALAAVALALLGHDLDLTQRQAREAEVDHQGPLYWDEHYYVSVAHMQAAGTWIDPCWPPRPPSWDHPPLAKLVLTASVRLFDTASVFAGCRDDPTMTYSQPCYPGTELTTSQTCYRAYLSDLRDHGNAYAWRMPSAILGSVGVLFTALAVRRLAGAPAGLLAGGLLLLDGVFFVMSRAAMLEAFAAGLSAVALFFAASPTRRGALGAGLFLGLAFASKYTALFAGPPVLLVALWVRHRHGTLTPRRAASTAAAIALLPAAVWVLSYAPWWWIWTRDHGLAWAVSQWTAMQVDAFTWFSAGRIDNPYLSAPASWLLADRPPHLGGVAGHIYAMPNPILWWTAALASLAAAGAAARRALRRARRAPPAQAASPAPPMRARVHGLLREVSLGETREAAAARVLGAAALLAMAGFLLLTRPAFNYYLAVASPFLAASLGAYLWAARDRPLAMAVVATGLFLVLGGPVVAALGDGRLAPGAPYLAALAWAGAAGLAALAGWAFGRPRLAAAAGILVAGLAAAAFWHYLPILRGTPLDEAGRDWILKALPWTQVGPGR